MGVIWANFEKYFGTFRFGLGGGWVILPIFENRASVPKGVTINAIKCDTIIFKFLMFLR